MAQVRNKRPAVTALIMVLGSSLPSSFYSAVYLENLDIYICMLITGL